MKIYIGTRTLQGCIVTVQIGSKVSKLKRRLDLRRHSPTGFEWGYGGSGPAQLALAILADCLANDRAALRLYQEFKFSVVSTLDHAMWRLTDDDVHNWCRAHTLEPHQNQTG
jgi:hypothetical protein